MAVGNAEVALGGVLVVPLAADVGKPEGVGPLEEWHEQVAVQGLGAVADAALRLDIRSAIGADECRKRSRESRLAVDRVGSTVCTP